MFYRTHYLSTFLYNVYIFEVITNGCNSFEVPWSVSWTKKYLNLIIEFMFVHNRVPWVAPETFQRGGMIKTSNWKLNRFWNITLNFRRWDSLEPHPPMHYTCFEITMTFLNSNNYLLELTLYTCIRIYLCICIHVHCTLWNISFKQSVYARCVNKNTLFTHNYWVLTKSRCMRSVTINRMYNCWLLGYIIYITTDSRALHRCMDRVPITPFVTPPTYYNIYILMYISLGLLWLSHFSLLMIRNFLNKLEPPFIQGYYVYMPSLVKIDLFMRRSREKGHQTTDRLTKFISPSK